MIVQDIKPKMRALADKIVDEHLQTDESLSSLIAKVASSERFNDNKIKRMVALTNEAFVMKTGSRDVPVAGYNEVIASMDKYTQPKQKAASYSFPEYSNKRSGGSMVKSANVMSNYVTEAPKINVASLMRKMASDDIYNLKAEQAKIEAEMNSLFKEANNHIDYIKRVGYTKDDIFSKISKHGSALIDFLYDGNPAKAPDRINKSLYPMNDRFSKIASIDSRFSDLSDRFESVRDQLEQSRYYQDKLDNVAEVLIDG